MKVLALPGPEFKSNPYIAQLYSATSDNGVTVTDFSTSRLLSGLYDVWHLHWPDHILHTSSSFKVIIKLLALFLLFMYCKCVGTRILWTAHNLKSHEGRHPFIEKNLFWPLIRKFADGIIFLTARSKQAYEAENCECRSRQMRIVIPHGDYKAWYGAPLDQSVAKTLLNIPPYKKMLLFFGSIRPYKNVPDLIKAFIEIDLADEWTLVVAGRPDSEDEKEAVASVSDPKQVRTILEFIPDDAVHIYLSAADIVILPFTEIDNSGSAVLALGFGKPIIVPRIGGMLDLLEIHGADRVITYTPEASGMIPRQWLRSVLTGTVESASSEIVTVDWDEIGASTIKAYKALKSRP